MRPLGPIVRLQIQRTSLKAGAEPHCTYDPAPLCTVPRLAVSPDGTLGAASDGAWLVDVHHRAHPATRNADGRHGISVGFTAHYARMRERFGERLTLGCAGENLLAETAAPIRLEHVAGGLAVLAPDGRPRVRLRVLQATRPCRPFTGWVLDRPVEPHVLKESLRFLDGGMRGFYCVGEGMGVVEVGDLLAAL